MNQRLRKRSAAMVAAVALAGSGFAVMSTGTASAAPAAPAEKSKACDGGRISLDVDRENGRFEVEGDLDDVTPRARWRVTLKHDGKVVVRATKRSDREGDLDAFEKRRPNTKGKDRFVFRAKRLSSGPSCSITVTR